MIGGKRGRKSLVGIFAAKIFWADCVSQGEVRRKGQYSAISLETQSYAGWHHTSYTSTRTTLPGLWLLIKVGLIAKEVERRIVD